jgi:hypothetical protein
MPVFLNAHVLEAFPRETVTFGTGAVRKIVPRTPPFILLVCAAICMGKGPRGIVHRDQFLVRFFGQPLWRHFACVWRSNRLMLECDVLTKTAGVGGFAKGEDLSRA